MCSHLIFKLLSCSILFSVLLSLNVEPATAQSRSAAVESGYTLLERGWVNDAIRAFQQAVQTDSRSIAAQLGLAIAYQRAGQDENAWKTYQTVLSLEAQNLTALTAIGELATYRPEWQQPGIDALTTLLELQPQNAAARSQRALLYGYQGRFTAAIRDYELILAANPSSAVVLNAAQIYTYSGDAATGLQLFQQYLQTEAAIPNTELKAYLIALQKTGDLATAIQVATDRLTQLPADAIAFEIRSALAVAYQMNQQPAEALAALAPLRQNPAAKLPLARALSEMGRQSRNSAVLTEAGTLYQQILAQTEPSTGLLLEAADTLGEQPETAAIALQLYQQVLAQQPNTAVQLKALWLSYQMRQISKTELQQQVQQLTQPLPDAEAEKQQLAQALVRLDPPDPALLTLYQSLVSNEPFLQFRIAQIQLQLGDTAAARQALSTYQATKSDPAAELLAAEIERQAGNLAASAQKYEAIAARYSDSMNSVAKDALRGLAGVRLAQGQAPAALRLYQQLQQTYPDDRALALGYTALAYRLNQLSQPQAMSVLADWLARSNQMPPELFLLVGELPADPQREPLYEALLEANPNHIAINRRWVQLQASQNPDRARARVSQLLSDQPQRIEAYFVQGELGAAISDLNLASAAYETILARQPQNLDALAALAGVRFQQQRYAEANSLYQQVLAQKPDDIELRRVLAELKAAQDQPIAAWQQLRQLQQNAPDPTDDSADPRVNQRLRQLQIDFLRRRGFQPAWERY